jgi:hypothetical protein
MTKKNLWRVIVLVIATICIVSVSALAQRRKPAQRLAVCGNPNVTCPSVATFESYDLPFRVPKNAVIWETELFYAVILRSAAAPDDSCDNYIPEPERLAAQTLFPDRKVFTSRCAEPGRLYYTNTSPKAHFIAVYAGTTLAEADRVLAAAKATGKFPGANLRRMRAGFNRT